ncbi:MAG: outer membrane protein assembly factor BamE [Burkholderiales bacterium]|nr:outer membrane protein assembly factor BamE [Burkholderiales bacterium]
MRISFFLLTLLLASCSSLGEYKVPIRQGNYVTQEKVDQLSPGMTRSQVLSILGTPLIMDAFHQNRWDYVYSHDDGMGKVVRNRLTLFFDADNLAKIEGKGLPEAPMISTPPEDKGFFSKLFGWF